MSGGPRVQDCTRWAMLCREALVAMAVYGTVQWVVAPSTETDPSRGNAEVVKRLSGSGRCRSGLASSCANASPLRTSRAAVKPDLRKLARGMAFGILFATASPGPDDFHSGV